MKKITFLAALLISAASFAQIAYTSFEAPDAVGGKYTDTDDPATAHALADNAAEPVINFTASGGEMGFNASYSPYDTPDVGLSDGDFVGVTNFVPSGSNPYPDGDQGYQISDVDGNYTLMFDPIVTTSTGPSFSIKYFVSETGYEGDGTVNESGDDRIRIYVKNVEDNTEYDILNSTGQNINDMGIEGQWITDNVELPGWVSGTLTYQLIIEVRCNSSNEAFFFDSVAFSGLLGLGDNNQNTFAVYPNPANGSVNITSQTSGNKNVIVYDILGKQVINTTIFSDRLDISNLTSGLYLLNISQNGVSSTKKLIVK